MAVGLSAVNLANKWLDMLRGTAFTAPAAVYVKLHTGDPGASGTANVGAVTTRPAITWSAASAGQITITGTNPSWSMTTTETISHISLWDNATAGNFLDSIALTASQAVVNGNTLTLTSCTISLGTIAA
jgi:hypothetical protein